MELDSGCNSAGDLWRDDSHWRSFRLVLESVLC
jgi:hypothetical protein